MGAGFEWQILWVAVAGAVSFFGVWYLIGQARRRGWLAHPNERSSHSIPTPTGAGLAIAIVFLAALVVLGYGGWLAWTLPWALGIGGGLLVAVGWLDEHRSVSIWIRLGVQTVSAMMAVVLLMGAFGAWDEVSWYWLLGVGLLVTAAIVWTSNMMNFMDGIDGLLGVQSLWMSVVMGGVTAWRGFASEAMLVWILGACMAGFLIWNWHPARIFLGDVGSVPVGFWFVVLALWLAGIGAVPILVSVMLAAPVLVDASATTLKRLVQGKPWMQAHRTFSYQYACRGGGHARVVIGMALLHMLLLPVVLLPIAVPPAAVIATIVVYAIWGAVWFYWQNDGERRAI